MDSEILFTLHGIAIQYANEKLEQNFGSNWCTEIIFSILHMRLHLVAPTFLDSKNHIFTSAFHIKCPFNIPLSQFTNFILSETYFINTIVEWFNTTKKRIQFFVLKVIIRIPCWPTLNQIILSAIWEIFLYSSSLLMYRGSRKKTLLYSLFYLYIFLFWLMSFARIPLLPP